MKDYKSIITHYESCLEKHGDTYLGVDWPNEEDALKRYAIMLDVVKEDSSEVSLLDFGCGTSHLYGFLKTQNVTSILYSGLDISESFINVSKEKYPTNTYFQLDILEDVDTLPMFDYIICNGVFTEKRELPFEDMWEYFKEMLIAIFSKCNKGIAFNVMSKSVDWERDDLFHLSTDKLITFMIKELSRNFVIRNDYGLYEYTVYLYK